MISANWDAFNYKFSEKKESSFEWLCYLLFCRKYGKSEGILAYFNQAAIETDPIEVDGDVVGWQAKYYKDSLSTKTSEITKVIKDVRKYYPKLKTLIFYTNSEWGQTKGKIPKGKSDVEKIATSLKLKIEWKTKSFFDSEFVCVQNADITSFFFEENGTLEKVYKNVDKHNNDILENIKSSICCNGVEYKLDRSSVQELITKSSNDIVVISGEAGVGKSAVVKDFLSFNKSPFVIIKAFELERPSSELTEFFKNLHEYVNLFSKDTQKYFVIDSAEKFIYQTDNTYIFQALKIFISNKWKVIITTRKSFNDTVVRFFEELGQHLNIGKIDVAGLCEDDLINLLFKFKISIPTDLKLLNFIRIPFYLDKYIQAPESDTYRKFKDNIWGNSLKEYSQEFVDIITENLKKGNIYLKGINNNCSKFLLINNIIAEDNNGYYIAQDIYEDLALEKYINQKYCNSFDFKEFFQDFPHKYAFIKAFRKWFFEKIEDDSSIINKVLDVIDISSKEIQVDEILSAILTSSNASIIFDRYYDDLLELKNGFLKRIANILFTRCKVLDFEKAKLFGFENHSECIESYIIKPNGYGWHFFFHFVNAHFDIFEENDIALFIPLMRDWVFSYDKGETTGFIEEIALKIYDRMKIDDSFLFKEKEKIFEIILQGSLEKVDEIRCILIKILDKDIESINRCEEDFVSHILKTPTPGNLHKTHLEEILRLAEKFWIRQNADEYDSYYDVEHFYGINDLWTEPYNAVSAMQTPILILLYVNPEKTIDWIVRFTNRCVETYHKSEFGKESKLVDLKVKSTIVQQIADKDLWELYRGIGGRAKPDVLVCIHMALEYYLLRNAGRKEVHEYLFLILNKSKSISLTAVVSSVVIANPEKFHDVAYELFRNKICVLLDSFRVGTEFFPVQYSDKIYYPLQYDERQKSNSLPHRKNSLGILCLSYQVLDYKNIPNSFKKDILSLIDDFYAINDPDETWHIVLQKMDSRKNDVTIQFDGEKFVLNCQTKFDNRAKIHSQKIESENEILTRHNKLYNLSQKHWCQQNVSPEQKLDSSAICNELSEMIKEMEEKQNDPISVYHYNDIITLTINCLIRDEWSSLSSGNKEICLKILLSYLLKPFYFGYWHQFGDGTDNAILALGYLSICDRNQRSYWMRILLYSLFRYGNENEVFKKNARKSLFVLNLNDKESALQVVKCFVTLIHPWNRLLKSRNLNLDEKQSRYQYFFGINDSVAKKFLYDFEDLPLNWCWDEYTLDDFISVFYLIGLVSFDLNLIRFAVAKSFDLFVKSNSHHDYEYSNALAFLFMRLPTVEITGILNPILNNYDASSFYCDFLGDLIVEGKKQKQTEKFWIIWNAFKTPIVKYHNTKKIEGYKKEIYRIYLFGPVSKSSEWHTFFSNDKIDSFVQSLCESVSQGGDLLFPISSFLYRLIPERLPQNIESLHKCLKKSTLKSYDANTILALEFAMKIYAHNFKADFVRNNQKKNVFMSLLDFLIDKGSVTAYFMKEDYM